MLRKIHAGLRMLHERRASMGLVLVRLDGPTLRVASAGMPPLLVRRHRTGRVEEVMLPGVPLGTLREAEWPERDVAVDPGDVILLMSDGLAEVSGGNGDVFGYDGVRRSFSDAGPLDPEGVVAQLLASADSHRAGEAIVDDVTLVVLRVRT
jgi:sigma-B regulation protein RsbU (phosphoserine phosphatase)